MQKEKIKLNRYGKQEVRGHITGPLFITVIFFLVAGRLDLCRAWIWAAMTVLYYAGGMLVLLNVNRELLNERGNWNRKKDVKVWDKAMLMVFAGVGLYTHTIVMALDTGRYGWTSLDEWFILPGTILYTGCFILIYWSMAVNTHFETGVRIQHDRDHRVVSAGPYRVVRHPGYLGLILGNFASAMIIGSALGFITATANLVVLVIRAYLEDRTLMQELDGYREYSGSTPYRLFPGLW
jgi:protein-S-isoprenylcysteine O-methyltransferase Ste14